MMVILNVVSIMNESIMFSSPNLDNYRLIFSNIPNLDVLVLIQFENDNDDEELKLRSWISIHNST